jgi:hypothetical protein
MGAIKAATSARISDWHLNVDQRRTRERNRCAIA